MPGQGGSLEQEFDWSPKSRSKTFPEGREGKMGRAHILVWMPTLIRILPPLDCSHNIDRLLRVPRGLEPIPGKEESCTAWPCQTHGGASLTSVLRWQEAQSCYIKDLACSWSPSKNT